MAKLNTFECDICHVQKKKDEKGWLMSFAEAGHPVKFYKWDEETAQEGLTIKHLCGIECAQKWLAQQLGAQL